MVDARVNNSIASIEWNVKNESNAKNYDVNYSLEETQLQISVIIPVYNQEKEIIKLLSKIRDTLNPIFTSYELVVVDDGSTDNTLGYLREEENKPNSKLRTISYTPNRGKGYAVREGVLQSTGLLVLFIDGDLEISPVAMKAYIGEIRNCDLVIASKVHPLSHIQAPRSRRFLSKAFNLLARASVGIRYKDTQSGMKVGKGDLLRAIFKTMLVKRYAFDVELLAVADLFELIIKEMPTEVNIRKRFKAKEITRMALDLAAVTYRLKITGWYSKQFINVYSSLVKKQANEHLEEIVTIRNQVL
jgi:glycosyltransferase involved in cell wall biosynthesis